METLEMTQSSELIYEGKIVKLKKDTVILPDGQTDFREIVEHCGGSCVLAIIDEKIALVSQFRYAYNCDMLELPAGKCEKNENPLRSARRELLEETGLICDNLELICAISPSPGYTNEKVSIYYGTGITKSQAKLDDGEFLNVVYIEPLVAFQLVESGIINDAKTVIALLWLKNKMQAETFKNSLAK